MVLRVFVALVFAVSALPAQAREVILGSSLGFVNVVDLERCDTPHISTYATSDIYAKQMASDPYGYIMPYLNSVNEYDWFCRRSAAEDLVLPIDYYVMGVKIAEIRLKVVLDPPWIIESVEFLEGVEVPKDSRTDFMARTITALQEYNAEHNFFSRGLPVESATELSIPNAELEQFAEVDDGFSGRADVLELLAFLKYDVKNGATGPCKFDKSVMERAAEAGNTSAMYRLLECMNEGTSVDAIRNGHPGLSELNDSDYNKFRYYLAKAIFSGYLPANLYVSMPIPKFQDQIPLDEGTISEIMDVVERLKADPSMTFADYQQESDTTRSVTSNAARGALNKWFLSNKCIWAAVVDSASEQGNDMGVIGGILGNTNPTDNGWCMSKSFGTSILLKVGGIERLDCTSVGGQESCSFDYRMACYATSEFGDSSAGEILLCSPIKALRIPGEAVFTRDGDGKLSVLSFGNEQ